MQTPTLDSVEFVECTRDQRADVATHAFQRLVHLPKTPLEMYYNVSSSYMTMMNNSLPSPEYTGDSDSDSEIIQELEQKRRQLDEEIANFRAHKEKEFKDFEAELKARRRQKRALQLSFERQSASNNYEFTKNSPSATPPNQSMPSGREKKACSPRGQSSKRHSEPIRLIKPNSGPKATSPTICLDRMTIQGQNVPKSHASPLQTPPTPSGTPSFTSSNSSRDSSITADKPVCSEFASINSDQPREHPPVSPEERFKEEAFAGLFVPGYLQLHGSRNDRSNRMIEGTATEPASPTAPSMIPESMTQHSTSLPTPSSIPDSFHVPTTKRSYTSPSAVTRGTLAPIIRNVNGRKRTNGKRKHVTFQLADRAIVEPSSSYEEGPSPDLGSDSIDRRESGDSVASATTSREVDKNEKQHTVQRQSTSLDPFGRRRRTITPIDTPPEEIGMSMADLLLGHDALDPPSPPRRPPGDANADGYFASHHVLPTSLHSPESSSPEKPSAFGSVDDNAYNYKRKTLLQTQKEERRNSRSPRTSPNVSRQNSVTHVPTNYIPKSPKFSPRHSPVTWPWQGGYPGTLEDDMLSETNNVGFFELDEELSSPNAGIPRPGPLDDDKGDESNTYKRDEVAIPDPVDLQTGTSVPIDIVRHGSMSVTNSWIGTFGH